MKLCDSLLREIGDVVEAEDTYSEEFLTGKIKEKLKELNLLSLIKNFPKVIKSGDGNVKLEKVRIDLTKSKGANLIFTSLEAVIEVGIFAEKGWARVLIDWVWKYRKGSKSGGDYISYHYSASTDSWDK